MNDFTDKFNGISCISCCFNAFGYISWLIIKEAKELKCKSIRTEDA